MPVRIARDEAAAPAEFGLRQLRSASMQLPVDFCERELEGGGLTRAQIDLPVPNVRSPCGDRKRTASGGSHVFQKLDARPMLGAQRGDSQMGAKDVIQMLLFGTVVLARTGHAHSQGVPVEMQTPFGITHYDGGVIDTQEQSSAGVVPFRQALARGKGEHLEIVAVRVMEIKRFDSSRVQVPVRQTLRTTRSMLNVEAPQPSVRCRHVAHDDGYVLEPSIVAARIDRSNRWRGAGGERGIRATQEEYAERLGSRTQCRGRTLTPHRRAQFRPVREPDVRAGICEGARLRL